MRIFRPNNLVLLQISSLLIWRHLQLAIIVMLKGLVVGFDLKRGSGSKQSPEMRDSGSKQSQK